ncbi:hypothetical protein [Herbihabitans rhizosphaerae]|uniref:hypothetical protein n=1 Tax=Herbihabitans rhizosphaerae TaxID=1872711 RepID=UPI00102B1C95|nr:hypothetical protein [Herbihabitans rhizosphaerae]
MKIAASITIELRKRTGPECGTSGCPSVLADLRGFQANSSQQGVCHVLSGGMVQQQKQELAIGSTGGAAQLVCGTYPFLFVAGAQVWVTVGGVESNRITI